MRTAIMGLILGAGLAAATLGVRADENRSPAQNPVGYAVKTVGASDHLIALNAPAETGDQHVVLVDPQTRVMSVYWINPSSGEIELRSVRNCHYDLQMDEYNGVSPSPREIRALLDR